MSTFTSEEQFEDIQNPVDSVETLFGEQGWPYERTGAEEISATISGQWCDYHLRFFWREEGKILQMACMFDLKVPESKRHEVYETLALLNERVWLGHFETWSEENVLMFRHASIVKTVDENLGAHLCSELIETALAECERFYPVFQFVIWAGKTPDEAIESAMLETMGEA